MKIIKLSLKMPKDDKISTSNLYTSNFDYAGIIANCVMVKIQVQDRILGPSAFTLYHLLERDSSFELDLLGYDQNSFFRNILK